MGPGNFTGHIGDEGRQLGLDTGGVIYRPRGVQILRTALLHDADLRFHPSNRLGHDLRQDRRALTAADNKDVETVAARKRLITQRDNFGPDRIADQYRFGSIFRIKTLHVRKGGRNQLNPPRQQPVHPAKHGVGIVDRGRNVLRKRREQRRKCWISTKADDGSRTL